MQILFLSNLTKYIFKAQFQSSENPPPIYFVNIIFDVNPNYFFISIFVFISGELSIEVNDIVTTLCDLPIDLFVFNKRFYNR